MKKVFTLAVSAMLFSQFVSAQTLKKKETVQTVTLWSETTYKLNGGARASVGGASRQTIAIDLPANTIEWYYSITTFTDGATTSDKINLAVQIGTAVASATTTAGKVAAFTGLDAAVVNAVKLPSGSMPVNTFVLNSDNATKFMNKESFTHIFSNGNLLQGTSRINSALSGRWYVGIQNPSTWSALGFKIEIVAITRETKWVVE